MPFLEAKIPNFSDKTRFEFWHRLEPRSRANDFTRSIEARIRDPLWMLTRQWQMGEFKGEDAGSPVNVRLQTETTGLTRLKLGSPSSNSPIKEYNPDSLHPLETLVEQETISLDWRTRVQIGQQFERELQAEGADSQLELFKNKYSIDSLDEDETIDMDDATQEFLLAVAGRSIDGKALLMEPGMVSDNPVIPLGLGVPNDETEKVIKALKSLHNWFSSLYSQPSDGNETAWHHDRFEYEFSVSAPEENAGQKVLVASEHTGEALDWYSFSEDATSGSRLGPEEELFDQENARYTLNDPVEFIPRNVSFRGMPNHRWWEFEDQQTDFGDLTVNTTDLGKLLVMEFALVHGNDWFLIPLPLKIGSICRIRSLAVTDVFGKVTNIHRAGSTEEDDWQDWKVFSVSKKQTDLLEGALSNNSDAADFLFIAPTIGRGETFDIEQVRFLRDEMANMVWAVERYVANGLGDPVSGYESCRDRLRRLEEKRNRDRVASISGAADELSTATERLGEAAESVSEATTPEGVAAGTEEVEERAREVSDAADKLSDSLGSKEELPQKEPPIRYQLATTVPENWIPYVPVHTDSMKRSTQLQRAMIVRNVEKQEPEGVEARSRLLKSAGSSHRINEEAVTRAALKVLLTVQRTRWIDGSTHLWISRKTGPGQGEGSSGLRFDHITKK
jgi:hypothetical protein